MSVDAQRVPSHDAHAAPSGLSRAAFPSLASQTRICRSSVSLIQREFTIGGEPADFKQAIAALKVKGFSYVPASLKRHIKTLLKDGNSRDFSDGSELMAALRALERTELDLSEQEVDVLTEYTGGWYKEINKAYLSQDKSWLMANSEKTLLFLKAYAKTRKYDVKDGTLRRVYAFDTQEAMDAFVKTLPQKAGDTYTAPTPMSSSVKMGEIMDLPAKGRFTVSVLFKTIGKVGADLTAVINESSRSEAEVLWPPGAKFERVNDPMFRDQWYLKEVDEIDQVVYQPSALTTAKSKVVSTQ